MPPAPAVTNDASTAMTSDSHVDLKTSIRADLGRRFPWPAAVAPAARPLRELSAVIDLRALGKIAAAAHARKEIAFTMISREYIQTGLNWIQAMRRLELTNFFVVAGDMITFNALAERGVHSVLAAIDESNLDAAFMSDDGFSAKGLAMIALKFPVARFLLEAGYSVVFSDADAVWLQDPMAYVRGSDVAFQRIVYHPAPIASLWGFAACTGFVFFGHSLRTIAFVNRCVAEHQSLRCDQVAMNMALLDGEPDWRCEQSAWTPPGDNVRSDRTHLCEAFGKSGNLAISGELRHGGLRLVALPHDKFWRHQLVASSLPDMVVCHPNSPKDDGEKIKILDAIGARFPPEAPR